jgi:glutamate transport system permease protein
MTSGQTRNIVVFPLAFRAALPPLTSTYIALTKNTAIAAAFGVTEATFQLSRMIEATVAPALVAFLGIALGYMAVVWAISGGAALLESRVRVVR